MRDISSKVNTYRTAQAQAVLELSERTLELIRTQQIPKGDPFPVAKVAAIQAAKNTSQIIPYCHPIPVDAVEVGFEMGVGQITVLVEVKATYKTGVEMEALTAANIAALTLYDMLKMLDEELMITQIRLLEKRGGKSDFTQTTTPMPLKAAVLVMSDSISQGKKTDRSGRLIQSRLETYDIDVVDYQLLSDDPDLIRQQLITWCDQACLDLIVTTGGTGLTPRDNTPTALDGFFDKLLPGVAETMRQYGQQRTPYAMLSRSQAGVRGQTLIISLPGSSGGVEDSMNALFPGILHSFHMIQGGNHPTSPPVSVPEISFETV